MCLSVLYEHICALQLEVSTDKQTLCGHGSSTAVCDGLKLLRSLCVVGILHWARMKHAADLGFSADCNKAAPWAVKAAKVDHRGLVTVRFCFDCSYSCIYIGLRKA
jgi:hypothetical protein